MAPKADEYFNEAVDLVRCAPQFILHPTSSSICLLSRVLTVHRSRPWQCISTGCTTREAYDGVPQLHARGEGAVQNIYKRAIRKREAEAPPPTTAIVLCVCVCTKCTGRQVRTGSVSVLLPAAVGPCTAGAGATCTVLVKASGGLLAHQMGTCHRSGSEHGSEIASRSREIVSETIRCNFTYTRIASRVKLELEMAIAPGMIPNRQTRREQSPGAELH